MAEAPGVTRWGHTCCSPIRWSRICARSSRCAIPRLSWMETSTGSWKQGSGGATGRMTTNTTATALNPINLATAAQTWHDFWRGPIGEWIITRGLRIAMLVIAAVLAARLVQWVAQRVTHQLDEGFAESDALVRSEATKHRQAVAGVVPWAPIGVISLVGVSHLSSDVRLSE